MSELDDFLTKIIPRQTKAEEALLNGDPAPRLAMWSTRDPVSLFGAWGPCRIGASALTSGCLLSRKTKIVLARGTERVASRFSNCTSYRFEVIAAGVNGDLAYTVGYKHSSRSVDGSPVEPSTLRVTHCYRREDGEWKIVHRHGDILPPDQSPPSEA